MGQPTLSTTGRILVLVTAFAGWLFAGLHLCTTSLAMQPAAIDLLGRTGHLDREAYESAQKAAAEKKDLTAEQRETLKEGQTLVARWFAWYQCAFLFGAATGGLVFGRVGDRLGRATGMGLSILTYSVLAAAASQSRAPWQLLVLWYLACTGVGGMWPNGVALVSEAWSGLSRPLVAGLIGTSANIGIFGLATLATTWHVTPEQWRWVLMMDATPSVLGVFVLLAVPESPLWLAKRAEGEVQASGEAGKPRAQGVFGLGLLPVTLLAIALATVPLVGGWGSANWMVPWADKAGQPELKAQVSQWRALTGTVGSALGGGIAALVGRRLCYSLTSLAALFCAQYTFWLMTPSDSGFLIWVSALGFFSGVYFGWLPLFLPELFPTAVRSTGAGVGFNFGRILTAATIFLTGALMALFAGDYARIGRVTSLVFVVGAALVWLAPDTTRRRLDEEAR